jgi:hypothetical protein
VIWSERVQSRANLASVRTVQEVPGTRRILSSKQNVAGSSPVSRSTKSLMFAPVLGFDHRSGD